MAQTSSAGGIAAGRSYPRAVGAGEACSRYLSSIGPADGPEIPLIVQFTGITDAQQRAAIGAFPGGKRFVLADPKPSERLLRQS